MNDVTGTLLFLALFAVVALIDATARRDRERREAAAIRRIACPECWRLASGSASAWSVERHAIYHGYDPIRRTMRGQS